MSLERDECSALSLAVWRPEPDAHSTKAQRRQRRATATCDSEGARKRRRGQDPRRRTSTTTSTVHGVHMLTNPVHHAYPLPLETRAGRRTTSRDASSVSLYTRTYRLLAIAIWHAACSPSPSVSHIHPPCYARSSLQVLSPGAHIAACTRKA